MYSDIRILLLYREIKKLFPEARILTKEEAFDFKIKERSACLSRLPKKKPNTQIIKAKTATEPPSIARWFSRGKKRLIDADQYQMCIESKGGRK